MIGDEVRDRCFTFGFGQRLIPVDSAGHVWPTDGVSLANGYVIVRGTRAQALEAMRRRFGQVWSFDYEDALVAGVERYGLWQVLPPIDATGIVDVEPVADPARAVADKPGSGPARVIMGQTMSRCSVCGGNADPNDPAHVHGGPGDGLRQGSSLSDHNGCGVMFVLPPLNEYTDAGGVVKLTRRHLEQALILALDDLAEQRIALDELGDRWQLIHDLLDKARTAHRATRDRLGDVVEELDELRSTDAHLTTVDRLASSIERDAASTPEVQP